MAVTKDAPAHFPRIAACGDSALTIEFADGIDEATSARVVALANLLANGTIIGIRDLVPTYRSLLVQYDPALVRGRDLTSQLLDLLEHQPEAESAARHMIVPVLYGGETGADLDALAALKEMTRSDLIALHASARYRVYMIGFAPGFAYLGGLPERLHTPRLAVPRQRIEAGAIGIGGQQASINSVPGPSGWRFIARTPLKLFDPYRAEPCLLRAGDRIRFRPIEAAEAADLDAAVARGEPVEQWEAA